MSEAGWELVGLTVAPDGVVAVQGSAFLRPTLVSGRTVRMAQGFAMVGGFSYENTANLDLTSSANSSAWTRIDSLVLRRGNDGQIAAAILPGTPAASPVAATPTQLRVGVGAGIWEMVLATWIVPASNGATASGLVDGRQFSPKRWTSGRCIDSTDATGAVNVAHGLGIVPASVLITAADAANRWIPRFVHVVSDFTNFQVVAYRTDVDTETVFASNPVSFNWAAFA